jgi:hypothetical protein
MQFAVSNRVIWAALVLTFAGAGWVSAQYRDNGRKVVAVVPMIGRGTHDDPRRPMYVPARPELERDAEVDFQFVPTADGKSAVVEFTLARPNKAGQKKLDDLLASKEPGVKTFERGKDSRALVEAEIRKVKPDFDFDEFAGAGKQGGKN